MNTAPESDYREAFAAALVARDPQSHPPGLDAGAARRFRVYRNNVHGALIGALADAYPVLRRLVGADFFAAMAREYFLSESSRAPSLALYGAGFADFVESFAPASGVVYLADVARLERARLESLHAADAPALDYGDLPKDGGRLLALRLVPHPALRLVESQYPIVSIWRVNQSGHGQREIIAARESALVTRPAYAIETDLLDEPVAALTRALMAGAAVGDACRQAAGLAGDFDVGAAFSRLLEAGAFLRADQQQED